MEFIISYLQFLHTFDESINWIFWVPYARLEASINKQVTMMTWQILITLQHNILTRNSSCFIPAEPIWNGKQIFNLK